MTADGVISSKSETTYHDTQQALPGFVEQVKEVKEISFNAKPIQAKAAKKKGEKVSSLPGIARNVLAVVVGWFMAGFMQRIIFDSTTVGLLSFAITTLIIMNNDTESKIFKTIKYLCCVAIGGCFSAIFQNVCLDIVYMEHYIIGSLIIGIISFVLFINSFPKENEKSTNIKRLTIKSQPQKDKKHRFF